MAASTESEGRSSFYRVALERYPVWTREQEKEAGRRLVRARAAAAAALSIPDKAESARGALRAVLNEFVCRNMRLVFYVADRYRTSGVHADDLVQRGALGLMRAAQKFEPSRKYRFCTYAMWWVRQSITRGVQDESGTVRRPTHMHEIDRKLRRGRARIAAATGRDATDEELSTLVHKRVSTVQRVTQAQATAYPLSLDAGDPEGHTPGLYGIIGDDSAPSGEDLLEARERAMFARGLLATLGKRERDVLASRYAEDGMTLAQLGEVHGVSRERIRQLESRALDTLRRRVSNMAKMEKTKSSRRRVAGT